MSDLGSFTFPDLGIEPLTPEQLGQIDPAQLAAAGTPDSVQTVAPRILTAEEQKFYDDPYLAYGRAKYGTETGTLGGTPIVVSGGVTTTSGGVTTTSGGVTTTSGTGVTTGGGTGFTPSKDARNTIKAVLATYGLGDLSDYLYGVYAKGEVDINNPDALIFAIRGQEAYQKRFAANAARAKKGLAELDPASYLQLENSYRQLLQSNGLPPGFYDQTEDFTALLEGDVSPQELQTRVQEGFRAVQDADPEVKRQMQELYGVNETGLAAYFLDPEKAAPILTRQAEAAKIAARAKEQGNIQLLSATAEEIAARGITAQEAKAGFTALGLQKGLYTEMMGEQALTQQEKVGAALGYDVEAQRKLAERKGIRKAAFQGGGTFTRTTGQTSGTTQTGLGVAE